jgi:predicted amidohydrolase YtcJ
MCEDHGAEHTPSGSETETRETSGGLSRRGFLRAGSTAAAAGVVGSLGIPQVATAQVNPRPEDPAGTGDLILMNGRIHTMGEDDGVVSAVAIRNGRVTDVGRGVPADGPDARIIDLKGRTVVPGIVDGHNHIVLMGIRPGYHTPLENAYSVADVQATLAARAQSTPQGEFVTTIGGFHPNQFNERRLPNLAELDAAVPNRPVYIQIGFSGPAVTNSLGKSFFESADPAAPVGADGSIAAGAGATGRALLALTRRRTFEDELRSSRDAMAYAAEMGVTTHLEQGAFQSTDTPNDGAAHADLYTMHNAWLELNRRGEDTVRLRINFVVWDSEPAAPLMRARLANTFPFFGNDMTRTGGIGEHTTFPYFTETWREATRLVAQAGWRNENHSLSRTDFQQIIQFWEQVNTETPIGDLRWVVSHVPFITPDYLDRLNNIGGGVSLTGFRYLAGTATSAGPPFRTILDNGIHVGMTSDGMQIAPMNPWLHMYYATTGLNARGDLINDGQQITRQEALRMYTASNGWFIGGGEDDKLGTLRPGSYGDLVVLNHDYFTVPDEQLKSLRSVMTVTNGAIVHDAGVLSVR